MLSCNCLNIIIEFEQSGLQEIDLDSLGLSREEKENGFFKQDMNQVQQLNKISKQQSGLVGSANVGAWVIYQCINCDMYTHAIHRERGAALVLVSKKLLTTSSITKLQDSDMFSPTFSVVVFSSSFGDEEKKDLSSLSPDVQLALGCLKQRLVDEINRERIATEERVRLYTEQQYNLLDEFKKRVHDEHKSLSSVIMNRKVEVPSQVQPLNKNKTPAPHDSGSFETVPMKKPNTTSSDKHKHNIIEQLKNSSNHVTLRQMSSPVPVATSIDTEGLFTWEGEGYESCGHSSSDADDSDNDESARNENVPIPRSRTQQLNLAKSLPMNIPAFMSASRGKNDEDEEHDNDMLIQENENPSDIAASIKALAKSVHGEAVFGDLPKPRFSTQI